MTRDGVRSPRDACDAVLAACARGGAGRQALSLLEPFYWERGLEADARALAHVLLGFLGKRLNRGPLRGQHLDTINILQVIDLRKTGANH